MVNCIDGTGAITRLNEWAGGLPFFFRLPTHGLDGWVVYIGVSKSLIKNAPTLECRLCFVVVFWQVICLSSWLAPIFDFCSPSCQLFTFRGVAHSISLGAVWPTRRNASLSLDLTGSPRLRFLGSLLLTTSCMLSRFLLY